jgi:transcriptional regulator with XRE-family HTH domain
MSESDLQSKLGERIRAIRAEKNMTQNELAIECDFEKASMSRIESGQANPTIRTLYKISKALNINITELFKD